MSTISSPKNSEFEANSSAFILRQEKDTKAALAQLSVLMEAVVSELNSSLKPAGDKIVYPNFGAEGAENQAPSNGTMEAAYSALVGLLAQLQTDIATYSNTISQDNAGIGRALMQQMQAQFNQTIDELNKIAKEQADASFWSRFTKWIEGIVAAIGIVVSSLCGQPELAIIIFGFTALSLSGGMDKITQGIADLISKALVADGLSKETADKIAKVLADIIVVVTTVIVTVATCGAAAPAAAENAVEETAEEAVELADLSEPAAMSASAEVSSEEGTSSLQKFLDFFKENNPFSKLSKTANFGLLTGSMTFGSTGLSSDLMNVSCLKMQESDSKETLTTALGTILALLATLAGAGASVALFSGPESESMVSQLFKSLSTKIKAALQVEQWNLSTALRTLMAFQILGALAQVSGQTATGAIKIQWAETTAEQGAIKAFLSELQSLTRMNTQQSSSDAKSLASAMKTWGSEIAVLSVRLNDLQRALAQELQA